MSSLSFAIRTRVFLQKSMLLVCQLIKKFPIESGASHTAFKTAPCCHKPQTDDIIQTHPFIFSKTHFSIILPFTPGSCGFPFIEFFNTKNSACVCLRSHACYIPRPSHHFFPLIIRGERYESRSTSLCSLVHYPVPSSSLCPDVFLSTQFVTRTSS